MTLIYYRYLGEATGDIPNYLAVSQGVKFEPPSGTKESDWQRCEEPFEDESTS